MQIKEQHLLYCMFIAGLAYTLDKKEGNCSISPIGNISFDVGAEKNAGFVVKMKSPLNMFYLNGSYRYAGQVSCVHYLYLIVL